MSSLGGACSSQLMFQVLSLAQTRWVRKSLGRATKMAGSQERCEAEEEGCEEVTCAELVPEAVQLYVQVCFD